jgi:outer membrane lipoprotein-sorting protein
MPKANQYSSIPGDKLTAGAPGDLGDGRAEFMDYSMMLRYRGAQDFANGAKLIRQEPVDFAGKKLDCYVLQVVPTSDESRNKEPYTWWVDKSGYRILREDSPGSSDMFKVIRLNEPLSDDLFKFTPPPGARRFEMTIL